MANDEAFVRDHIAKLDKEDEELSTEIARLEVRRARVRTARGALVPLITDEPVAFPGTLADAVRTVLTQKQRSLAPVQVRDAVRLLGYDLSKHDNEMAAVHGVLKSLETQGQVKTKTWRQDPDTNRYYWTGPNWKTLGDIFGVSPAPSLKKIAGDSVRKAPEGPPSLDDILPRKK